MKIINVLLAFLLGPFILFAQSLPYNQEFQVNTYTYEDQIRTQVVVLSSGSIVFCWDSWEHLGSYRGVYAQMFDENGFKYCDEIPDLCHYRHVDPNDGRKLFWDERQCPIPG